MNANRTIYVPIYMAGTNTFDRIGVRTHSSFSGTASVRLGIYNNSAGAPSTVVLDAGTVSATAASTFYQITIDQELDEGWYWLAANTQTAASTNNFWGSNINLDSALAGYANDGNIQFINNVRSQDSVTGAFATAGSTAQNRNMPLIALRKKT
jgi:hypothetical protein